MKTLFIIRHAKSSWSFDLDDHDRPLGLRGRNDVLKVARYLSKNVEPPQLMISSTASRALYTALYIADEWGYPEDQIILTDSLYHASASGIVSELSNYKAERIAIFGHNPGFTNLVNELQGEYVDNLSTCGVVAIEFEIDDWAELTKKKGKREFLIVPKKIK